MIDKVPKCVTFLLPLRAVGVYGPSFEDRGIVIALQMVREKTVKSFEDLCYS